MKTQHNIQSQIVLTDMLSSRYNINSARWLCRELTTAVSLDGRRGVMELRGSDAGKLLQSVATQELSPAQITKMAEEGGGCLHTAFLTNKGRVHVGDALVFVPPVSTASDSAPKKEEEDSVVYIDAALSDIPNLLRHLRMYKLRAKVKVRDASDDIEAWALYEDDDTATAAQGSEAASGGGGGTTEAVVAFSAVSVAAALDPRVPPELGWTRALLLRNSSPAQVLATLPGVSRVMAAAAAPSAAAGSDDTDDKALDESTTTSTSSTSGTSSTTSTTTSTTDDDKARLGLYDDHGLSQGLCEGGEWCGHVPLELNLEHLGPGVSFSKGCYLGQELTARTHFQGMVRKRVLPLMLTHTVPDDDGQKKEEEEEGGGGGGGEAGGGERDGEGGQGGGAETRVLTWAEMCEKTRGQSPPLPSAVKAAAAVVLPGDSVVGLSSGKVWGTVVSAPGVGARKQQHETRGGGGSGHGDDNDGGAFASSSSSSSRVVVVAAKLRLELLGLSPDLSSSSGGGAPSLREPLLIVRSPEAADAGNDDGDDGSAVAAAAPEVISGAVPYLPSWWPSSPKES